MGTPAFGENGNASPFLSEHTPDLTQDPNPITLIGLYLSFIHLVHRDEQEWCVKLLIDTGSSLGLALFTTKEEGFTHNGSEQDLAVGIGGSISGHEYDCRALFVGQIRISRPPAFLILHKIQKSSGSLGAAFLRNYVVIFDHSSHRLLLKKNT